MLSTRIGSNLSLNVSVGPTLVSFHLSLQTMSLICGVCVSLDIAIDSDIFTLYSSIISDSQSRYSGSDLIYYLFAVASIILSCSCARQELVRHGTRCLIQARETVQAEKETCTAKIKKNGMTRDKRSFAKPEKMSRMQCKTAKRC